MINALKDTLPEILGLFAFFGITAIIYGVYKFFKFATDYIYGNINK